MTELSPVVDCKQYFYYFCFKVSMDIVVLNIIIYIFFPVHINVVLSVNLWLLSLLIALKRQDNLDSMVKSILVFCNQNRNFTPMLSKRSIDRNHTIFQGFTKYCLREKKILRDKRKEQWEKDIKIFEWVAQFSNWGISSLFIQSFIH